MSNNYNAVVFHHNDLDGKAAGYCVHKYFAEPWGLIDDPNNYFKKNYNEDFNYKIVDKNSIVFIVDLSFTANTFKQLVSLCNLAHMVIWIDHHQSSIDLVSKNLKEFQKLTNLVSFLNNDGCGALLTYILSKFERNIIEKARGNVGCFNAEFASTGDSVKETYCIPNELVTAKTVRIPNWLFFIDDYDRFVLQDQNTEFFVLGSEQRNTSLTKMSNHPDGSKTRIFNNEFWDELTGESSCHFIEKFIKEGCIIRTYLNSRYKRELINAFEFTLPDGITILCKNAMGNSWNFCNEYENYPAVCIFSYDGKNGIWRHSVFARNHGADFNAAKFCERFGGGGHAGAAGFSAPVPIFTDKESFEKLWNNTL